MSIFENLRLAYPLKARERGLGRRCRNDVTLLVRVRQEENQCSVIFQGSLVAETQVTIRSIEAMLHTERYVIFDLSRVDLIDEIGMGALRDLARSVQRENGVAKFDDPSHLAELSAIRSKLGHRTTPEDEQQGGT